MKLVLSGFGFALIFIGIVVAMLTPIPGVPIGAPISITGVALVARNSNRGRAWIARRIDKHPKLAKFVPDRLRAFIFGKVPPA